MPTPRENTGPAPRLTFPRRLRLQHAREFKAVRDAKLRKSSGPISLSLRPNGLDHPRLGLSISRAVGGAVRRNALKRAIREAFRLTWRSWPTADGASFDMVVSSRAHEPLTLDQYAEILGSLVASALREAGRRDGRRASDGAGG
ncbi:MAG: ribonuclease P protein component [Phycisphaeraceae bacterium]|nr:MAG: ribonuclease P protein component [Phycisphaeraceae bacterium]